MVNVAVFVEKRPEFEVVLFTGGPTNGPETVQWIIDNNGSAVWLDAQEPTEEFEGREESIRLSSSVGTRTAKVGWYIVKDEDWGWNAYPELEFHKKYESV